MPTEPVHAASNLRRELVRSESLVAEELIAHPDLPPRGDTTTRQVAITYAGVFEFQVGRVRTWVDPSRVLFAEANQSFRDHHVIPGMGHQSVILAPSRDALEELCAGSDIQFENRVARASSRLHLLVQLLRRSADNLEAEELGFEVLTECLRGTTRTNNFDTRCVRRAKAILHNCCEGRLTLSQVAEQVGVTPVYLTQTFKRAEGVSLYRYQTRLRLARALTRHPHQNSITALALECGYSSHSHFAAAFRAEFGVTPSEFRGARSLSILRLA